jgi:hypothetical protein
LTLKLIEQDELINDDSSQHNQLGTVETFDGDLSAPFKDVFEQAIKRLNGFGAELVKDTTYFNPDPAMGVFTPAGSNQQAVTQLAGEAHIRRIVMSIAQHIPDFKGQLACQITGESGSSAGLVH